MSLLCCSIFHCVSFPNLGVFSHKFSLTSQCRHSFQIPSYDESRCVRSLWVYSRIFHPSLYKIIKTASFVVSWGCVEAGSGDGNGDDDDGGVVSVVYV